MKKHFIVLHLLILSSILSASEPKPDLFSAEKRRERFRTKGHTRKPSDVYKTNRIIVNEVAQKRKEDAKTHPDKK